MPSKQAPDRWQARLGKGLKALGTELMADIQRRHWGYSCAYCGLSCAAMRRICPNCVADMPCNTNPCRLCALPLSPTNLSITNTSTTNISITNTFTFLKNTSIKNPFIKSSDICSECQAGSHFNGAFVPYQYTGAMAFAVRQFKQQNSWLHGDTLLALLRQAFTETPPSWLHQIDAISPVPVHWHRLWQRGFNPSAVLAQGLGRHLQLPVYPFFKRHQTSPKQQGLKRHRRLQNLKNTFAVQTQHSLAGKNLLLVDDVITTGATLQALAKLGKSVGIQQVYVCAIARTPKPHQ